MAEPGLGLCVSDEVTFVLNTETGNASGPSPLVNSFGARIAIPFDRFLSLEPGFSFYWTDYDWIADPDTLVSRPMPVEMENLKAATVLAFPVTVPLVFTVPLSADFSVFASLGPALNARVAILAAKADPSTEVAKINEYFWSSGRFFMPETLLGGKFRVSDSLDAALTARALWPIANLWSGESVPFFDGIVIAAGLRLSFSLGGRAPTPVTAGKPPE